MKKININKTRLIEWLKKHLYLTIIIIFSSIIIWDLIFIFQQVTNKEIDPLNIISHEEQINQSQYDSVMAVDNKKKESNIEINKINNPF